jgi:Zn-dependent protease
MNFENIINSLPGIILGLTLHEACHAFAAYRLGDNTARLEGRLSFNPLKHIDPIGFLFLIIAGFGWAKPVRFNPQCLSRPRRDKAIIAAAGPVSNFLLALIFIVIFKAYWALLEAAYSGGFGGALRAFAESEALYRIAGMVLQTAAVNLGLFVFNLIPLPPLDGSHIFFSGLNLRPETEYRIMRIGAPLLFIILIIQNRAGLNILPIGKAVNAIIVFFIPQLR